MVGPGRGAVALDKKARAGLDLGKRRRSCRALCPHHTEGADT